MDFGALRKGKRERWWAPANDEQRKLFELAKQDVVCYLSIMREGLKCSRSYGKFAEYMENAIDFTSMGFTSFGAFLFHCDDCLEIRSDGYEYYLFLKDDGAEEVQEVAHIQDLVQNQRKPVIRRAFEPKHNNTFSCPSEKLLEIYYDLRVPEPEPEGISSFQNHNNHFNRNGGGFGSSRGGGNHGSYNHQGRGGMNFGTRSGITQVNRNLSHSFSYGSYRSSSNNNNRPMSLMELTNLEPTSSTTNTSLSNNSINICMPTLKPLNQSAVEYLKRKASNNNTTTTNTNNSKENNSIMTMKTQTSVLKPINQVAISTTTTTAKTTNDNNKPQQTSERPQPPELTRKCPIPNAPPSSKSTTTTNNSNKPQQNSERPPLNLPPQVISIINLSLASAVKKISPICSVAPPLRPLTSQCTSINTTTAVKPTANINSSTPVNPLSPIVSIPRLRTIVPKNRAVTNKIPVLTTIKSNSSRENKLPESEPITKVRRVSVLSNQPPPALKPLNQVRRDVSLTGDIGMISVRISNENSSDNKNSNEKNVISSQSQQQQQPKKLDVNPFYRQKINTDSDTITKMDIDQVDDVQEGQKSSQVSLNHLTSTSTQSDMDGLSTKMAKGCSIVEKKKICRRLKQMQMCLTMSRFAAKIVGADENGYIFVQLSDLVVQQSFNYFKNDIQRFYGNSENQDEYRMNEEIDQGIFTIVFLETSGSFIRGRIDEICESTDFCIVFDIDDCDFHVVSKKNVYHIHDSFTMRHPQAIMLIQKGTEEHMLHPKLNEILSSAFQQMNPTVEVTNISAPHPILRAPVACIKSDGKDLYEILNAYGLQSLAGMSSNEKHELLKTLEKKSHIVAAD